MNKINDLPPKDIKFGHELLPYFPLEEGYIMTNSGAHGVTPNYVLKAKKDHYRYVESNPDQFFRTDMIDSMAIIREFVSKKVNCPTDEIVIMENATEAINTVMKSVKYNEGDVILVYDVMYRMVEEVGRYIEDRYKAELVVMKTSKEILNSEEKLIELVEEYIEKYKGRIKLVVIDHVSANPAIIFPVKKLIELFRENKILSLIDASHALGQVEVDLTDIKPDYYVTNFHKWAYSAKSACVLYTKTELQDTLIPAIISHFYKQGFAKTYHFLATRDYSAAHSIEPGFEFMENFGARRVREYCHNLAMQVGKEVSKMWDTEVLVTNEEMIGNMVNILLPFQGEDVEKKLGREFCDKYNTYLKLAKYQGKYYARFCCQIFNEMEDYIYVAKAVMETIDPKGI